MFLRLNQQLRIFAYLQHGGELIFVFRIFNAKKAQQQIGMDIIPVSYAMPISSNSDIEVKLRQLLSFILPYVLTLISAVTAKAKIKHAITRKKLKLHRGAGKASKNLYLFLQ